EFWLRLLGEARLFAAELGLPGAKRSLLRPEFGLPGAERGLLPAELAHIARPRVGHFGAEPTLLLAQFALTLTERALLIAQRALAPAELLLGRHDRLRLGEGRGIADHISDAVLADVEERRLAAPQSAGPVPIVGVAAARAAAARPVGEVNIAQLVAGLCLGGLCRGNGDQHWGGRQGQRAQRITGETKHGG